MNFVLISFYPIRDDLWEVYGHYDFGHNELLDRCSSRDEAIEFCFNTPFAPLPIPVIQGQGERIGLIVERLANPTNKEV